MLVVGSGNTGAQMAQDLAEQGARRVWISIRTPPHIVSRNIGPLPIQRRITSEAHHPPVPRARLVIINPAAVLDAEAAIMALIARLNYAAAVRAEGMAIAERMLSNAERSPFYNFAEPGALRWNPVGRPYS